jgi:hypothetical protein
MAWLVHEAGKGAVVALLQGRDHLLLTWVNLECQRRAIIEGARRHP